MNNDFEYLLSVPAFYKKEKGILSYTGGNIVFKLNSKKLLIPGKQVEGHLVSGDDERRCMIRIQANIKDKLRNFDFEFTDTTSKTDRDNWSRTISAIVKNNAHTRASIEHVSPSRIESDLEKKKVLSNENINLRIKLLENEETRALYEELVKSGIVSEDDFWDQRKIAISSNNNEFNRYDSSFSKSLLESQSDTICKHPKANNESLKSPAVSSSSTTLTYDLDNDKIRQIFLAYPNVYLLYQEQVPHKMTEQEFWVEYFRTSYFHSNKNNNDTTTFIDYQYISDSNNNTEVIQDLEENEPPEFANLLLKKYSPNYECFAHPCISSTKQEKLLQTDHFLSQTALNWNGIVSDSVWSYKSSDQSDISPVNLFTPVKILGLSQMIGEQELQLHDIPPDFSDQLFRVTSLCYEILRHFWSCLLHSHQTKLKNIVDALDKQYKIVLQTRDILHKQRESRLVPYYDFLLNALNRAFTVHENYLNK